MIQFEDTELIYASLEEASEKIQEFLDDNQISEAHGDLMLKLGELNERMYNLDLKAIQSTSNNLNKLNSDIKELHETSKKIIKEIDSADDFIKTVSKVFSQVDKLLTEINKLLS